MNDAILECIIQGRDVTFLGTTSAAIEKAVYAAEQVMHSVHRKFQWQGTRTGRFRSEDN